MQGAAAGRRGGRTSHVKKAGVMRAFSSAPHFEYGKTLQQTWQA